MPIFKITTTSVAFLSIDLADEGDVEAFEDAIGEDGEISTEGLKELLEDDIASPYDHLDVTNDSQDITITQLTPEEEKALASGQ